MFPYHSPKGRYHLNFFGAQQACLDQDATLATFEQLLSAWEDGLDWCNAGWLADGTVQYPITAPRHGCGGESSAPGLRSYGPKHRLFHRFDAFCFSASMKGRYENPPVLQLKITVFAYHSSLCSRDRLPLKLPETAEFHRSSPCMCQRRGPGRQSGPAVRRLEAEGTGPLRRRLVGRWERALSHHKSQG